jgi:PAS domain S-box-containing protein
VRGPWRQVPSRFSENFGSRQRWHASIGLAIAVGVAYFLAARLSLFLLSRPDGVAVFWPAAGISSGTLIALRRNARWPVAVGVIAATTAANLTSDRTIWASVVFALCDTGEALLTAWVVERYVGAFSLDKLRHVLWLLAGAIIGTATAGVAAAVGYKLLYSPAVPAVITWWHWFSSDAIGIITTAPLIIGVVSVVRAPPPRREVIEGTAALIAVAAVMITIIFVFPRAWWDLIVPVELLFPLLLWIGARCRPAFTAAAVFVLSLVIACTFIFRLGHFSDIRPSIEQRIFATQAAVLGVAIFAYILAALFAERRQQAAVMEESENRMRAIVNTVVDGIITIDDQGTIENLNPAAARIFGYNLEEVIGSNVRMLMPEPFRSEHARYLVNYLRTGQAKIIGNGRELTGERKDCSIFPMELAISEMKVAGRRLFTGIVRDITERKLAEEHQKTLTSELQHRTNNLLTVIQIIANRTLSGDDALEGAKEILEARLRALARANKQLTELDWSGLTLSEIIKSGLEPYLERCEIDGTDIVLGRLYAQNFSLVLHELATNAIKYGALSNLEGRVHITWGTKGNGSDSQLIFHWREQGGPPVVAPKRQGFGSTLLRASFANVRSNFDTNGFSCEIEVPLREVAPSRWAPEPKTGMGLN